MYNYYFEIITSNFSSKYDRDLRFSRQWRYNSWFSGVLRRVEWWLNDVSVGYSASIILKMEAARPSETLSNHQHRYPRI